MSNKPYISQSKKKLIVYIVLAAVTLAVYWQVNQFDFIGVDDNTYITENSYIKSEVTLKGILGTIVTRYVDLWNPLVCMSFIFDYQLYGLNAGGYHVNNLILHIFSTLLLFWLFNRMTNEIWKSAFVAAVFALHPLHVESVAWVSERKDVLSAFFWMLTLCLYVYYTEKPAVKRYLLVLFSFVLALMSKPMVVTLPVIMILLDYWPLKRFESQKNNLVLWQLKEKLSFAIQNV
jgi:protein O-mannosyl-transferase